MGQQSIFEKHERDWTAHFNECYDAIIDIECREWDLVKSVEKIDPDILVKWPERIKDDRRRWLDNWGIHSSWRSNLKSRHLYELQEAKLSIADVPKASLQDRNALFFSLMVELDTLRDFYNELKVPIPLAVQRRMTMQVDLFNLSWDGIEPHIDTSQYQILDHNDLKNELLAWQYLREAQSIILHYKYPKDIPQYFKRRMIFEVEQFWRETDPQWQIPLAERKSDTQIVFDDWSHFQIYASYYFRQQEMAMAERDKPVGLLKKLFSRKSKNK